MRSNTVMSNEAQEQQPSSSTSSSARIPQQEQKQEGMILPADMATTSTVASSSKQSATATSAATTKQPAAAAAAGGDGGGTGRTRRATKRDIDMLVEKAKEGPKLIFPMQLHKLLRLSEEYGASDIVSWFPDGKAFRVHNRREFEQLIMKRFFNQSVYRSFLRQLNGWGYTRVIKGDEVMEGAYEHPLFLRDKPDLCRRMIRSKVTPPSTTTTSATAQSSSTQSSTTSKQQHKKKKTTASSETSSLGSEKSSSSDRSTPLLRLRSSTNVGAAAATGGGDSAGGGGLVSSLGRSQLLLQQQRQQHQLTSSLLGTIQGLYNRSDTSVGTTNIERSGGAGGWNTFPDTVTCKSNQWRSIQNVLFKILSHLSISLRSTTRRSFDVKFWTTVAREYAASIISKWGYVPSKCVRVCAFLPFLIVY